MGILRIFLALAVVFAHAGHGKWIVNSGLAVQSFFIISGFYMSLILTDRYRSNSLFYVNRILRIYPSYLIVALASLAFLKLNGENPYIDWRMFSELPDAGAAWALGLTNTLILGQDVVSWFNIDTDGSLAFYSDSPEGVPSWTFQLVPQAWSISLELMFYALAPFLVKCRTRTLLLFLVVSLAIRLVGIYVEISYWYWPRRFFPAELFLFLAGILAHRTMAYLPATSARYGWIVLMPLLVLLVAQPYIGDARWVWATVYVGVAVSLPFLFMAFRTSRWDRWQGELSYPIYLVHILVIAAVDSSGLPGRLGLIVGLTLLFSAALYWVVDRPIASVRHTRVPVQV